MLRNYYRINVLLLINDKYIIEEKVRNKVDVIRYRKRTKTFKKRIRNFLI